MNAIVESVRCLWVPLEGGNLLLPNIAIAEVTGYQPLDPIQNGPDWLLGTLRWRARLLPVVSMESLCGFAAPRGKPGAHISVLNSVVEDSTLPFYAMVTAQIPRLINVDAGKLSDPRQAVRSLPDTVTDCIRIGNEEALIPNLEIIQKRVETGCALLPEITPEHL